MKKSKHGFFLPLIGLLLVSTQMVAAEPIMRVFLSDQEAINRNGLFSQIDPDIDLSNDLGNKESDFFYNHCSSTLETPLWNNSKLEGQPQAFEAIGSSWEWIKGSRFQYDKKDEEEFKYTNFDFNQDESLGSKSIGKWYTNSIFNGVLLPENQTDALKRTTESWPIRAIVVGRTIDLGNIAGQNILIEEINTLTFDEKGNAIDGSNSSAKKRVGFACSSVFLINKKTLESSIGSVGIALSYYAPDQRMCHFFPTKGRGMNWWTTIGTLEDHRKMLLSRCKSPFWIPLKPDGSNQAEVEEYEKSADQKHLQSFIPSELDLSKPIESNNFILTVRFSDPVKPVYHASLPNQCLVDCPNTGAKQIEGLELKLKPIESKKSRKK
jgi:hypothetical protein